MSEACMIDTRFLLCAAVLLGAGVAPVQGSTPDPLAAQIRHCASLTAGSARLACYDALASSAGVNPVAPQTAAASSGTATAVVAEQGAAAPPKAEEFGVHNGPLEAKRGPVREKHMLAAVGTVSHRPNGELVVKLDNGQVWAQLQPAAFPLKVGEQVEIDVGALGSYILWSPSNRRATKVTRID